MYFKRLTIVLIFVFFKYNSAFYCLPCACELKNSVINVSCSYKMSESADNKKINQILPSIQSYSNKEQIVEFYFKGQNFVVLDGLSTFHNVEKIVFSHNMINNLRPNDLKNLTLLQTLQLDNNQISEIPLGFFQDNNKIAFIFLHNNKIILLAKHTFENLPYLKEVHLNENKIEYIEDNCFVNVPSLKTLDLNRNKLITLSLNFIDRWNSLVYVFLEKNPWICDIKLCDIINTSLKRNWLLVTPECFLSNGTKTKSNWENLQILDPVKIINFQSPADVNQTVVLSCEAHVCSLPSMVWSLNGNHLENSTHCIEGFKHTLTYVFDEIVKDDEGLYTCFIKDCSFCTNSSRYLTVSDTVLNVETTTWKEEYNTSSGTIDIDLPHVDLPDISLIIGIFIGICIGILIMLLKYCCCPSIFKTKCFGCFATLRSNENRPQDCEMESLT